MLRLLLRTLRARVRRTLMTSFAVVIGVALIAGTLIFTDTIDRSFDAIGAESYRGVGAVVTPATPPGTPDDPTGQTVRALPQDFVARVSAADGVRGAVGSIAGQAIVFKRDGHTRLGGQGPPALLFSALPAGFGGVSYVEGRRPTGPNEVAFDRSTARKAGVAVGDVVSIQGKGPRRPMRLVGLMQLGNGGASFGGATVAATTTATAAALTQRTPGSYYDEIRVQGKPGVSSTALVADLRRAIGSTAVVRTGEDQGVKQATDIKDQISFLPTMLLVFAGIATFVGAFLIFNTFSITVAQRQREFALLRALGAGRRQVRLMVTGEALVVGLVGAVLGMALGFVVAPALRALIKAFGADMPSTATVFAGRTVLVSLIVGVVVTLVASFLPARRATRVAPVEALREASAPPGKGAVRRGPVLVGVGFGVVGVAGLLLGVLGAASGDTATVLAGGGAGLLFLAATLISPALVGPLARTLGRPLRLLFGLPGRLAQDNAARQPGRTAVTSGALMIGLALVVFATVFAAGLRETLRGDIERVVAAPVVVQSSDGGANGLSQSLVQAVRKAPGVRAAGGVSFNAVQVGGKDTSTTVIDGQLLDDGLIRVDQIGSDVGVRDPGPGRVYVADDTAKTLGVTGGATVVATGPNGHRQRLRVAGVVQGNASTIKGIVMDTETAAGFGTTTPFFVLATGTTAAVERALRVDYPAAETLTRAHWIDKQTAQVNQLLGLVYALLALSVIVALFGIVNTLTLSIQERVRELGLLRAVGATRRQVRQMVLLEAVITALLGALLGAVLGFVLAIAVGTTLDGFSISVPIGQIVGLVVLTGALGVLAAVRPARRAAATEVLVAIADE